MTINDWELVLAAYGYARATQLVDELRTAIRDRDPFSADVKHGAMTALYPPHRHLHESLTYEFGWRPDEVALLVVTTDEM